MALCGSVWRLDLDARLSLWRLVIMLPACGGRAPGKSASATGALAASISIAMPPACAFRRRRTPFPLQAEHRFQSSLKRAGYCGGSEIPGGADAPRNDIPERAA